MLIAVPIWRQRVSPLLDTAERLVVVDCQEGKDAGRHEFALRPQPPEARATTLAGMGVDLLLCGAVTGPLLRALRQRGVRVRQNLCGDVEAVLRAWCHRQLARKKYRLPGCTPRTRRPSRRRNSRVPQPG